MELHNRFRGIVTTRESSEGVQSARRSWWGKGQSVAYDARLRHDERGQRLLVGRVLLEGYEKLLESTDR